MIRTIWSMLVAGFLLTLSGCVSLADDPRFAMTLKVVDDREEPVAGALASIGAGRRSKLGESEGLGIFVEGLTDEAGVFFGEVRAVNGYSAGYRVEKEGHYGIWESYRSRGVKGGRWQPWNPTIPVVLKRIRNPVPMYVRKAGGFEMDKKSEAALDLEMGELLPPWGKGRVADVVLSMVIDFRDRDDFDTFLTVSMPNPGDGMVRMSDVDDGAFPLPYFYEAPLDGYEPMVQLTRSRRRNADGFSVEKSTFDSKGGYVIRVRTVLDEQGNVVRAWYGRVVGDWLSFIYYLNPDGTRNLEWDYKENLAATLPKHRYEWPRIK